jgi:peptide/nickel transport system ATP-binding protein
MKSGQPVLEIEALTVSYRSRQGPGEVEALRGVSLRVQPGQSYGIVGESGSGKTTLALATMGYLPEEGIVKGGKIRFRGREIAGAAHRTLRRLLGAELALVPQDPNASLNPAMRLGEQVEEVIRSHTDASRTAARREVLEWFDRVRLSDTERVYRSYPHQVSGGMKQRVLLAMAMCLEPALLILDEPTTSLDVTTEAAVLDILRELIQARQTAIIYVSHNLGVVSEICDRVAVLYAGEVSEDASTVDLYRTPLHPYSQGLLDSVPRLGANKRSVRLRPIQGRIPALDALPDGCIFRPRCPLAIAVCEQYPPLYAPSELRRVRCHRWEEIEQGGADARQPEPSPVEAEADAEAGEPALLVEDLQVHFSQERTPLSRWFGGPQGPVQAVNGVSLQIAAGRTLGLVGESGSGKTTAARAIIGLEPRTGGDLKLHSRSLPPRLSERKPGVLSKLQIVFQEPDEALNPYLTVGETLRRPIRRLLDVSREEARARVAELLEAVHLPVEFSKRLPGQLSGGEKQRVALARAFASQPEVLLADEPVSSLDVSVQASVLNVMHELQADTGGSSLFISHDLAVVGFLSDEIAVIYLGRLMEVASVEEIFDPPFHPYTEALLSAIPRLDPEAEQQETRLEGELPSLVDYPTGCPFHSRCPRFLGDICIEREPPWRIAQGGRRIYCHIPLEELRSAQKRLFRPSDSDHSRGQPA